MRRFTEEKWGGTESVVHNISSKLIQRGLEAKIFCTDMLSKPGLELVKNVPVQRCAYMFPWFGLSKDNHSQMELKGGNPLSLSLLNALWHEPGVSLIHTHVQHRLGGIARTVARLKGIPYVVSIHGGHFTLPTDQAKKMQQPFEDKWEWGKPFGWLLGARRVLEDANGIICVGKDEWCRMREEFPQKQLFYLPNGVNNDQFANGDRQLFRQQFGLHNKPYILCVSRLETQKNQLLLLNAFAKFVTRHPTYQLVLIGAIAMEEYAQKIRTAITTLGLQDKVLLIPGLAPHDPLLASAYKGATIFVLPSHHEPFGIVVLEAWAAGVPVVASSVGGIPGFTQGGVDSLHFPDGDEKMLIAHLERLAADAALCSHLIAEGKQQVLNYDWSQIADKWLEMYQLF